MEQSESRQIFYFLCLNLVNSKFCKLKSLCIVELSVSVVKFVRKCSFDFVCLLDFLTKLNVFSMQNLYQLSDS